jgi:hypothetical protein
MLESSSILMEYNYLAKKSSIIAGSLALAL